MSRNGSGTYNLPAGNPVVSGTPITSTWANTTLSDIATALTGSVASDGQTAMTGNLSMGSNKITGLANGSSSTDAVAYGQFATPPAIGNTTANTGAFTTLTSSSTTTLNGTTIPSSKTLVDTDSSQTLTNKSLTNPTVTNYVETLYSPSAGSSFTVDLTNGTVQKFVTNANTTVTLPSSVAGKSYVIMIQYGGTHTLTWAGGSTIKWNNGTAPTPTSSNGKIDMFTFFCDGTNTYGSTFGQNF